MLLLLVAAGALAKEAISGLSLVAQSLEQAEAVAIEQVQTIGGSLPVVAAARSGMFASARMIRLISSARGPNA
jgi:hypothetical protein